MLLNDLDMQVLELLHNDARQSNAQIAIMLGKEESEILACIQRLQEEKIIVKYGALVHWEKTPLERVEAIIEVRVTPQRDHGFDDIAARIYRFDEVKDVYLMSGAYDLMLRMEATTMRKLAYFVAEKLSVLEHVVSTATHFVLKPYKIDGVILEEEKPDRRLVVAP